MGDAGGPGHTSRRARTPIDRSRHHDRRRGLADMRPRIVHDSLQGTTPDNLAVSIAVARIAKVDARQFSPGRTELLGLAVLIAWFGNRF